MSLAQILEEVKAFPTHEIEELEHSLRLERLQRAGRVLNVPETRLLSVINEPLPAAAELRELRIKREENTLESREHERLMALENEREIVWAEKLRAVGELADLRGEDFDTLYQKLGLSLRVEA